MTDTDTARETAQRMFDKLISSGWVKIPPGWSLVPDMPTPEQLRAALDVMKRTRHPIIYAGDDEGIAANYYAMVKAAPTLIWQDIGDDVETRRT